MNEERFQIELSAEELMALSCLTIELPRAVYDDAIKPLLDRAQSPTDTQARVRELEAALRRIVRGDIPAPKYTTLLALSQAYEAFAAAALKRTS